MACQGSKSVYFGLNLPILEAFGLVLKTIKQSELVGGRFSKEFESDL